MPAGQSEAPLFLLARAVDADLRDRFWGALVTDVYHPRNDYSTKTATKNPRELVEDLKPDINYVNDLEQVASTASRDDFRAKLVSMLEAFWHSGSHREKSNKSTAAEYWYMPTPSDNFKELFNNEEYRKDAIPWVRKRIAKGKDIFFVAAMATLADAESTRGTGKERSVGVGVAGIDPHTQTEVVKVEAEVGKEKESVASGTYVGTKIVAIGYYRVKYRKLHGARAWVKKITGRLDHELVLIPMDEGNDFQADLEDEMQTGRDQVPGLGPHPSSATAASTATAAVTADNKVSTTKTASTDGKTGWQPPPIYSSYRLPQKPAEGLKEDGEGAA